MAKDPRAAQEAAEAAQAAEAAKAAAEAQRLADAAEAAKRAQDLADEADARAAAEAAAKADAKPTKIRLTHGHGYQDDDTQRKRFWSAGDLIVDQDEVDLLVARGVEYEVVTD